jgi:hypothetical protein
LKKLQTGDKIAEVVVCVCSSSDHAPKNDHPRSDTHASYTQPTVVVKENSKKNIVIQLLWTRDLPVPKAHDHHATHDFLNQQFTRFREGVAEYIAP